MYKHFWYTVDHGMGKRCDKCDAYTNIEWDNDYYDTLEREDCLISDEEF